MQTPQPPTERPTEVIVLAILAWLMGLFEIITALLPLLNAFFGWLGGWFAWAASIQASMASLPGAVPSAPTGATSALGLLLGALAIAVGVGVWRKQDWGWPVGVIGLGATAMFQLIFLATSSGVWFYSLITFLVCVAMLVLFYRPQVKPIFGRP